MHEIFKQVFRMELGMEERSEGGSEAGIFEITDFTNATPWER